MCDEFDGRRLEEVADLLLIDGGGRTYTQAAHSVTSVQEYKAKEERSGIDMRSPQGERHVKPDGVMLDKGLTCLSSFRVRLCTVAPL